ncbi:hypothetical protein PG984_009565 [Apiospora sp. TS-2023a]
MCQFTVTYYTCSCPFVRLSSYKLCVDRPDCEKTLDVVEENTFCPAIRKLLASPWNQRRPKAERRVDEASWQGMCRECNPEGEHDQPGNKFVRCGGDICRRRMLPRAHEDPQRGFDYFVRMYWPPTPRGRYERRRDEKREEPEAYEGWASSFTDHL